ncbi:MAG: hypothetical protein ABI361_13095 [Nitrososphaera sp.]|jgi:hypothetical protein
MVKQRQALSIVGMVVAVLGAVAWYYHQYFPAAILWIGAGAIAISINRRKRASVQKKKDRQAGR